MRTALGLVLLLLLIALVNSPAGADTYYTLRIYPVADTAHDTWTALSEDAEYKEIDEGATPDDNDYIYATESSGDAKQCWYFSDPDSTTQGEIVDTVIFRIRASCNDKCGSGGVASYYYQMWEYKNLRMKFMFTAPKKPGYHTGSITLHTNLDSESETKIPYSALVRASG